jgi:DNA-binding response OmpR family regulator
MLPNQTRILLAEDDWSLAFLMRDVLEGAGYSVVYCRDGREAIDKFNKHSIDMCLLDVMMPEKDGYTVAKKIRQQSDVVPILFISTKNQQDDRLKGYHLGADDYISKPFNMQELLMKIDVFLRRTRKLHGDKTVEFELGTLRFSYTALKLYTPTEVFETTEKEADLLRFLCEHRNKIIKRNEMLLKVWGKEDFFLGRSMNVYITKIRKYLKADPTINLETIHGIGYRLIVPE